MINSVGTQRSYESYVHMFVYVLCTTQPPTRNTRNFLAFQGQLGDHEDHETWETFQEPFDDL